MYYIYLENKLSPSKVIISPTYPRYRFNILNSSTDMSTFKNIVNDFKTLNMMLMKHGDLQSNCNNIEYNKNLKKLMIIDVDSITPMFHWERIEISTRNCIEDSHY